MAEVTTNPKTGQVPDRQQHDAAKRRASNQPGGSTHLPRPVPKADPTRVRVG